MRRHTAFAIPAVLAMLTLLACTDPAPDRFPDRTPLRDLPVSGSLRDALALCRGWQSQPPPTSASVKAYATYRRIRRRIRNPETRPDAAAELYRIWENDQANGLWLSLANHYRGSMGNGRQLARMLARPAFADTGSAFGAFAAFQSGVHGRREHWLSLAAAGRRSLTPLTRLLVEEQLADRELLRGDHAAAVGRLLSLLPDAWQAGGHARVADLCRLVAFFLFDADRLDDALHAAGMAAEMAAAAGDPYQVLQARSRTAVIEGQRGNIDAALGELVALGEAAWRREWPWLAKSNLDRAAELATESGRYDDAVAIDHRSRAFNVATSDLLNLPRSLASIAHGHRMTGRLDSTRIYLLRAQAIVDTTDLRSNKAKMKELLAGYYCQVGQYARAESLLVAAAAAGELGDPHRAQALLLLDMLPSALEIGRPDLAYEWLARLETMREMLPRRIRGSNALAEFELLKARLLAEQGETRRAATALDRAADAVGAAGGEGADWRLAEQRGRLALQRGDPDSAERHYLSCLDLALRGADPRRLARARFQLGEVYLSSGRFADAEAMFTLLDTETTFGYAFRTGLTSQLLLATLRESRQDHAGAEALAEAALQLMGPKGPADLRTRLGIVQARAVSAQGRHDAAERQLRDLAATTTIRATHFTGLDVMRRDVEREIREARIANHMARGSGSSRGAGWATLAIAYPRLAARLHAGNSGPALIYFAGQRRSWSWLVAEDACHVAELGGASELADLVEPVLVDLAEPGRPLDNGRLAAVNAILPGALAELWQPGKVLALVADGPLVRVPWTALTLPGADSPVVEHGPIVEVDPVAPPLSRSPREPRDLPLIAIGSNGRGDNVRVLRLAEDEAAGIHANWPADGRMLLRGAEATWPGALAAGLTAAGVIHIASHAVVHQGDSRRSTLRLTSGPGDAVPVTMAAVRDLRLQADLVFLSSCRAGDPGPRSRHDFAGAFLAAGAGAVIAATAWVEDEAARQFATAFYGHWQDGHAPVAAVARARSDVRAVRPHPSYWAFYRIVGGPDLLTAR